MKSILLALALCAAAPAATIHIDQNYGPMHVTVAFDEERNLFVYDYRLPGWDTGALPEFTFLGGWFHMLTEEGEHADGNIWGVEGAEQNYMGAGAFTIVDPSSPLLYISFLSDDAPVGGLVSAGYNFSFDGNEGRTGWSIKAVRPSGWTVPEPSSLMLSLFGLLAFRRRR